MIMTTGITCERVMSHEPFFRMYASAKKALSMPWRGLSFTHAAASCRDCIKIQYISTNLHLHHHAAATAASPRTRLPNLCLAP